MKTCATTDCENVTEGNTEFCGSCNRHHRKVAKERQQAGLKKLAQIEKLKVASLTPRPTVKKVSAKRKELNKDYDLLRLEYLAEHPNCEIRLVGCDSTAIEIHHTYSGSNKVAHLNDVSTWKATCTWCHRQLHDKMSAKEARERGLKI